MFSELPSRSFNLTLPEHEMVRVSHDGSYAATTHLTVVALREHALKKVEFFEFGNLSWPLKGSYRCDCTCDRGNTRRA